MDDDEEAETRRLEAEIAASRQARLRRSTGYASRSSSVDLCEYTILRIGVLMSLTCLQHRALLHPLRGLKSARALQTLPSLQLTGRETRTMLSRSCWGRTRHHNQLHNLRCPSRLASPSALPNPCPLPHSLVAVRRVPSSRDTRRSRMLTTRRSSSSARTYQLRILCLAEVAWPCQV